MRKLVVGNWKANKSLAEALGFADAVCSRMDSASGTWEAWVAPPAPYLALLVEQYRENQSLRWVSQQVAAHTAGAHTGEFTAEMLKDCGVHAALVGHSERRERFGETDEVVRTKVSRCIAAGLLPVLCCGETREEREAGVAFARVQAQLEDALGGVEGDVVVAYEPVWAIGTGLTATSAQAEAMHAHVQVVLAGLGLSHIQVLYGGSVNPANVSDLFAQPHVDGALVGGASLDAESFLQLIEAGR